MSRIESDWSVFTLWMLLTLGQLVTITLFRVSVQIKYRPHELIRIDVTSCWCPYGIVFAISLFWSASTCSVCFFSSNWFNFGNLSKLFTLKNLISPVLSAINNPLTLSNPPLAMHESFFQFLYYATCSASTPLCKNCSSL